MTDPQTLALMSPQLPPLHANRALLQALSDDTQRAALYRQLREARQVLQFTSTADARSPGQAAELPVLRQTVALLTAREHIDLAFSDTVHFSNASYRPLGSGTFMLALDGPAHAQQRLQAAQLLRKLPAAHLHALIAGAWKTAAVLPLKQRSFNAAALAEQVALRFVGFLFGFPFSEHPVLEAAIGLGYQQLVYQIVGRHFEPQPLLEPTARAAGGRLLVSINTLLADYLRGDVPDDIQDLQKQAPGFVPLCQHLVAEPGTATLGELAVLVGGLMAGTIGNVQASVAIALDHLLDSPAQADLAQLARSASPGNAAWAELQARVMHALALNPPAALLPRQVLQDITLHLDGQPVAHLAQGSEVLLAIGSGTAERLAAQAGAPGAGQAIDPLIYGGGHLHHCLGDFIGTPLVVATVRNILLLPGLTRAIDPETGEALRLEKTWGFRCDKLPLEYARDRAMVQSPLAIVMPLRTPVALYADKLKAIIAVGAPRIEFKLAESNHVHFAWFLLLDNDSQLALFTTFDGDFDAYLKHFALEVGSLFDKLFECLADPPPLPVEQYPDEFVAKVKQYNRTPVGSYFFSAYPQARVPEIKAALQRDSA